MKCTTPFKTLLTIMACLLGLYQLDGCSAEDTRLVAVKGYNYTQRPIQSFSVNDNSGAEMSCCTEVTVGKPAVIKWVCGTTEKQYQAGVRQENRSTTVIVPPPTVPEASFLEVNFYPGHHVQLALVESPGPAHGSEILNLGELNE